MIVAVWHRWVQQGQWWWLLVLAGILALDVFVGSWLIRQELELVKGMMAR